MKKKEAERKEPDLAQILREMEDEVARDVSKVTAERSSFEQAEKLRQEAQRAAELSADRVAKIEAAASKCKKEQQSMREADRLNKIRAMRRTRDLEQEVMDLLNGTLESVFKAADSNGDGTLDRDEVEAAFKKSDALQISDESLMPILGDILDKNGGRAASSSSRRLPGRRLSSPPCRPSPSSATHPLRCRIALLTSCGAKVGTGKHELHVAAMLAARLLVVLAPQGPICSELSIKP